MNVDVVFCVFFLLLDMELRAWDALEPPSCNGKLCHAEMSHEKRLITQILTMYDVLGTNGRPVINMSTPVNVSFGLGLIQMDLDEKYKILKMSMWSRYKWRDEYLQWDPSQYGDVQTVRMDPGLIWIPDVMLYNTADPNDKPRDVLAIVKYDGSVLWVPHQIFKSSCSIDVTNFPFDGQTCHMWFGSWTHTREEVDLEMAFENGIDLSTFKSDYKDSCEWDIVNTVAEKKILPSQNETPNYSVLTFQLDVKRKLVFSSYILTLPCVFLACLTLVVFWLPPDRPDRTALAMSIFASFLLLLLILVEAAPPTASSVPVLGVYYCFNLVIIMLAVFLSTLVVNICRAGEGTKPVPRILKIVTIDIMSRIFCMRSSLFTNEEFDNLMPEQPPQMNKLNNIQMKTKSRSSTVTDMRTCNGSRPSDAQQCEDPTQLGYMPIPNGSSLPSAAEELTTLIERQVSDMNLSLANIRQNIYHKNAIDARLFGIVQQWRDVAMVMDRFFFLIYMLAIVISLVFLFPRPK